ncbi:MAG: hypothetical protein E7L00_04315 [Propionibacteriaceae bacterium]|nr:hypothetical protein [Propionibacteriaceae bacterium]
MAMTLPGWLTQALQYVGYEWPSSNEDILRANGDAFRSTGQDASTAVNDVRDALRHILGQNETETTQAFSNYMYGDESNLSSLEDFEHAANIIGSGFDVIANAVVAVKLAVIAQLVILAGAIAAAIWSGGLASAGPIAAREAAKRAIDLAINIAIEKVVG